MMSLRNAINTKCKECIYDPHERRSWRQEVEKCTSTSCFLYEYRPLPIKHIFIKKEGDSKEFSFTSQGIGKNEKVESEMKVKSIQVNSDTQSLEVPK